MGNCEGCPFEGTVDKFKGYCHLFGEVGHREFIAECHLTPDHQRIIDAMIRGVWECIECGEWDDCKVVSVLRDGRSCKKWKQRNWDEWDKRQERKEGEDEVH